MHRVRPEVRWAPREANAEVDRLANGIVEEFLSELGLRVLPPSHSWYLLDDALMLQAEAEDEMQTHEVVQAQGKERWRRERDVCLRTSCRSCTLRDGIGSVRKCVSQSCPCMQVSSGLSVLTHRGCDDVQRRNSHVHQIQGFSSFAIIFVLGAAHVVFRQSGVICGGVEHGCSWRSSFSGGGGLGMTSGVAMEFLCGVRVGGVSHCPDAGGCCGVRLQAPTSVRVLRTSHQHLLPPDPKQDQANQQDHRSKDFWNRPPTHKTCGTMLRKVFFSSRERWALPSGF